MSAHVRAVAAVRELRAALRPAARLLRSVSHQLADRRREQAASAPTSSAGARGPKRLILESALAAANSLQAPIVSS
ncbi:hypothetical protein ENSA5_02520 [Enhygromyxa salina]|uniref:Uncharacterized protein n=1 Tax=Enhygromyxa salina TaxID=215803 RepID=A0A2S9YK78_9BACT|nr:hypothetical protein [Enhygromyxa salina]PRQ05432.1 hypothetical protein ENSA5_02520 [Enhygromyxa salina]